MTLHDALWPPPMSALPDVAEWRGSHRAGVMDCRATQASVAAELAATMCHSTFGRRSRDTLRSPNRSGPEAILPSAQRRHAWRRCRGKQVATERQLCGAMAVGKEADMSNAMKAAWHSVLPKAAEGLDPAD